MRAAAPGRLTSCLLSIFPRLGDLRVASLTACLLSIFAFACRPAVCLDVLCLQSDPMILLWFLPPIVTYLLTYLLTYPAIAGASTSSARTLKTPISAIKNRVNVSEVINLLTNQMVDLLKLWSFRFLA